MDGRHSGLKVAAPCLLVIHEPELHGRHGGLKAGAGDPHGAEASQMLLVPLLNKYTENIVWGFALHAMTQRLVRLVLRAMSYG
jgi:hypothetical protein